EDGIRDFHVTGVQTCALPISMLLQRFEPARIMQTVTLIVAVLLLMAGSYPNVWFWFPLRFLIGAFNAMLWIASEALINELAEERSEERRVGKECRGRSGGVRA